MAPRIKTSPADIIEGAIAVVREQGMEFVNARSVAAKLNCSIQPIFRTFGAMEDLKAAVYEKVESDFNAALMDALVKGGFGAVGLAYINYAKTEPNLFQLLFASNIYKQGGAKNIAGFTAGDEEVLAAISSMTGLDLSKAQELYTGIWFTAHGIASLLSTNNCTLNDEETKQILKNVFEGLLETLKKPGAE